MPAALEHRVGDRQGGAEAGGGVPIQAGGHLQGAGVCAGRKARANAEVACAARMTEEQYDQRPLALSKFMPCACKCLVLRCWTKVMSNKDPAANCCTDCCS